MTKQDISLRDRQKMETRRQIQEAAKKLISDLGYEKTTMRALAKAAGVGVGTIALHFQDKKSLLMATFYEEVGEVAIGAMGSVPDSKPLRDQLAYILGDIYGYYANNTKYLRPVIKEVLFVRGEWCEIFETQIGECFGLVVGLIEKAKARGEVRPEVESLKVTSIFWSVYLSGLIEGFKQERFDAVGQTARVMALCDVVLDGITTAQGAA